MKRRHVIAGAGSIGLASLAGCLGTLGLSKYKASPAGVDKSVRKETGYEQIGVNNMRIEKEVGVSGVTEKIVVENFLTEHEKTVDMGPLGEQRGAVFMVLSTPQVKIAGKNFNPVEDKSTSELIKLVAKNYDSINNIEHVSDDSVTVLDQSTTISMFSANAKFNGSDVDVNLHVTEAVKTEKDLLVTVGVYPKRVKSQEKPNIRSLAEGVVKSISTDSGNNQNSTSEDGGTTGNESSSNESSNNNESNNDGFGL